MASWPYGQSEPPGNAPRPESRLDIARGRTAGLLVASTIAVAALGVPIGAGAGAESQHCLPFLRPTRVLVGRFHPIKGSSAVGPEYASSRSPHWLQRTGYDRVKPRCCSRASGPLLGQ